MDRQKTFNIEHPALNMIVASILNCPPIEDAACGAVRRSMRSTFDVGRSMFDVHLLTLVLCSYLLISP